MVFPAASTAASPALANLFTHTAHNSHPKFSSLQMWHANLTEIPYLLTHNACILT